MGISEKIERLNEKLFETNPLLRMSAQGTLPKGLNTLWFRRLEEGTERRSHLG